MEIRRLHLIRDRIYAEGGLPAKATAVSRVAASAVIVNPFTGQAKEDLSILIAYGATLGEQLSKEAIAFLNRPVVSYGKAAIVGTGGDIEHGAAIMHPKMGMPRNHRRRKSVDSVKCENWCGRRTDRRAVRA